MDNNWKTIHEVATDFDIKLTTLRNFLSRGNYLGEHVFKKNGNKFKITENDKKIKLINGRKTILLSPNFVDYLAERFGADFPIANHLRKLGKQTLKSLRDPNLTENQLNYRFYKFQKEIEKEVKKLEEQLRNQN